VVVDTAGKCAGVLDDRTVVAAWAANPAAMTCDRIATVLPRTSAVIAAEASVLDAAKTMRDQRVDAVAVLDRRGVAIGIVTGVDMVALLAR
jgi:predicted transcriptional regulator